MSNAARSKIKIGKCDRVSNFTRENNYTIRMEILRSIEP